MKLDEVSANVSYMIVRCHKLPKKPWPLTIGGMPLWITSDATETPEIEGRGGRAPPIMDHLPFSTVASPTGQHFNWIAQYFLKSGGHCIRNHVERSSTAPYHSR